MSTVGEYIAALLASPRYGRQVTHHRILPGREACFGATCRPWPGAVSGVLAARGIPALYSHQVAGTDALRAGRHIIAATPTASGKSLIYNLPILERFVLDPDARALMIFPLKALARDQMAAFSALTAHWPVDARPTAAIYDGDTPDAERRKLRRAPPAVLATNPEMLHLALLPHHERWTTLFASLTLVVVDEAHIYRGVLGAHMAQIFRRMGRICARYGSRPVFALCSATVGNPQELAQRLLGLEDTGSPTSAPDTPPVAITESGAPCGSRHMVFIDPEDSPSTTAIALLQAALARGLRAIVYCRSRRMTELIALWAEKQGTSGGRISAYRAGFLPEERRDIERRLSSGELAAVVSTSALELGIDIGGLDVCILVGYPGTVMATLQRSGRVGRSGRESAVLLVAGEDALDHYFIRNPEAFFTRGAEHAVLNPDNDVIVKRHLECAAAELPLRVDTDAAWLHTPGAQRALAELSHEGLLLQSADGREWLAARKRPHRHVDLRGCGAVYVIEDAEGAPVGAVDALRALRETHPGAIYLHRGKTYVITEIDPGTRRIRAEAKRVDWFTRTRSHKLTEILAVSATATAGGAAAALGKLRVTETISGYERRSVTGNRLLDVTPLDLPPLVFETEGFWLIIPDSARRATEDALLHFMGGIHALEHALIGLMPLAVMADRNDFGGISIPMHPQLGKSAVFVYDALPGGAGLCRAAFFGADRSASAAECGLAEPLAAVERTVRGCSCENGCPSCVHSPKCGSGNRPIAKDACLFLLDRLVRPSEAMMEEARRDAALIPSLTPPHNQPAEATPPSRLSGETATTDAATTAASEEIGHVAGPPCPPPAPSGRVVVFDVETRRSAAEVGGWDKADRMGVSVAVLYDSLDDGFHVYSQDELDRPGGFFDRLRQADLVVGFNSLRFDYKVLQPFTGSTLADLPTLDLLDTVKNRLGYRVSLDNLARATLDAPKSADGLLALRWWKEGRLDAIAAYCRKDVELTRDLYRYGCSHGYVLFTTKAGQPVRLPVDWATAPGRRGAV